MTFIEIVNGVVISVAVVFVLSFAFGVLFYALVEMMDRLVDRRDHGKGK